jgi:hypothetical protein
VPPRVSAAAGIGGSRKPGPVAGSSMRPRSAGAKPGGHVRVGGISGRRIMASASKDCVENESLTYPPYVHTYVYIP